MNCNCNNFNHMNRRDFLGRFALGLGGAALMSLLNRDAHGATLSRAAAALGRCPVCEG